MVQLERAVPGTRTKGAMEQVESIDERTRVVEPARVVDRQTLALR
jgi:hypothetical protein